jgi:predicted nucleic acid-binding protein
MRVMLDACVLYPTVLREIVLGAARAGLFTPLWSARILAEWQHAAARLGPAGAAVAEGEIALLRAAWPEAEIAADPARETMLDLPDAADRHVLAVAIAGQADVIATLNLRDFPRRALDPHGLRAEAPDALLMRLWLSHPETVEAAVRDVQRETVRISGRPQPLRALLKRARLPRLGKALAAGAD